MLIIDKEDKVCLLKHLCNLKMFYRVHKALNRDVKIKEDFQIAFESLCELERRIGVDHETD